MAFSIDTSTMPRLDSWIKALSRWEATKPWRGASDTNTRPLDRSRAQTHKTIRRVGDDIVCRLYRTDVVTYHKDDSITLSFDTWNSVSTGMFADYLTPGGLVVSGPSGQVSFTNAQGESVVVRLSLPTRFVRVGEGPHPYGEHRGRVTTWKIADESTLRPFRHCTVNRKKARAALISHKWFALRAWAKAYKALSPEQQWPYKCYLRHDEVLRVLAGSLADWKVALDNEGPDLVRVAKEAIYATEKCIVVTERLYVPAGEVPNVVASERMYRSMV